MSLLPAESEQQRAPAAIRIKRAPEPQGKVCVPFNTAVRAPRGEALTHPRTLTLGTGGRAEDPSRDRGDQELSRLGAEQGSAQQGTFLGAVPPRDEAGELGTLILTSPKRDVHPTVKSVGGAQRELDTPGVSGTSGWSA